MGSTKNKVAMHDDKTDSIIKDMAAGKSRKQISDEMGNKSYATLHMYMRRHYFSWDKENKKYIPIEDIPKIIYPKGKSIYSTKADETIALLSEGLDPKEVALRVGFKDYKEMAAHMKNKGFEWNSDKNNYIAKDGETLAIGDMKSKGIDDSNEHGTSSALREYLPILKFLFDNKDQLYELLKKEEGELPRYAVPGLYRSKAIHMADSIQCMIKEFCTEKNISQKVVIEVAVIEFFRKYGFKRQIDSLLKL